MPNAVPTIVGTPATGTLNAGTSLTANLPASIAAGELLLLAIGTTLDVAITTPAGWTPLAAVANAFNAGRLAVFGKIASGSEGASVAVTVGSCDAASVAWRNTGHDPAQPFGVPPATNSGTGTSTVAMTSPSVTTQANNSLIVRIGGTREAASINNPGSHTDIANASSGSSSVGATIRACYAALASAGAAGTANFTSAGADRDWQTITLAINPILEAGGTYDDRYRFRPSQFHGGGTSTRGCHRSAWPDDALDFGLRDSVADNFSRLN